jgi:hypothetical protein
MANRFWVGGTATWTSSATANWSTTSGGASGASVPGSADTAIFDVNSGAVTATTNYAPSITAVQSTSGFTGTLALGAAITMSGGLQWLGGTLAGSTFGLTMQSFQSNGTGTGSITGSGAWTINGGGSIAVWTTASTGPTYTASGTVSFTGTTGTNTITTGGLSMPPVNINGTGGTWNLQDTYTCAGTLSAVRGTFNTNNQTMTVGTFNMSNTTTRAVNLGSSSITCTTTTSGGWDANTVTALTFSAGSSTITLSAAGVGPSFGGLTYNNVILTGTGTITLIGANTFTNLTYSPTAGTANILVFPSSVTTTVTSTFTVTASVAPNKVLIQSSTLGAAATVSVGTVTITTLGTTDWMDITGAGAASPFALTSAGDCGGNSNLTLATPGTYYWFANTGNYSTVGNWYLGSGGTGGAGRVPLPQDTAIFDANSLSTTGQTITLDTPREAAMNWSAVAHAATLSAGSVSIFGSLTLASGLTLSGFVPTFAGRGSYTITCAGTSTPHSVFVQAPGGTRC